MIVFGLICVISGLAGTLYGEVKDLIKWQWVCKPIASSGFLLIAFEGASVQSVFSILIVVGLMFSWFGDLFLMSKRKKMFLLGLLSFLLAHLVFAAAFLVNGTQLEGFLYALVPVGVIAVVVLRWLLPILEVKMKIPVLAYITVITLMVLCASSTFHNENGFTLVSGAVFFFISDLFVARQRFVKKESLNRLIGLPLYYTAQVIFAMSLSVV